MAPILVLSDKAFTLDGKSYSIIGVIPERLDLLLASFRPGLVYLPIGQWGNNLLLNRGAGLGIHGIGRLKPAVSLKQARADMSVTSNLSAAYPDTDKGIGAPVFPLKQDMVRGSASVLWVLPGAVGFVLLIGVRQRCEPASDANAGAQPRVCRPLCAWGRAEPDRSSTLTERVLPALTGGLLGLLLAKLGTHAARARLPRPLPRAESIGLDTRVLACRFFVSITAGIFFGFAARSEDFRWESAGHTQGPCSRLQRSSGTSATSVHRNRDGYCAGSGRGRGMVRTLVGWWNVDPDFDQIGFAAASGPTRLMPIMLFAVKPTDPLTYAAVAVLWCVVALLACYLPARRAMRVVRW